MDIDPIVEGHHVLVTFPKPTRESRQELVKLAKTKAEDAKNSVRNTRKVCFFFVKFQCYFSAISTVKCHYSLLTFERSC